MSKKQGSEKKPKSNEETVEKLLANLEIREFRVRNEAIKSLGKLKHSKAKDKLVEIAESNNSETWDYQLRVAAINALGRQPKDNRNLTLFMNLASNQDLNKEIRRAALTHLSRYRDPKSINVLLKALDDDYRFVRFWAVRGLLKIQDPKTLPGLIKALGDSDEEIRKDVQNHLELYGKEIIPHLAKALKDQNSNKYVRYGCMGLLGRINHPDTIQPLIDGLNDGNDRVVTIAIRGLGKTKSVKALEGLIASYKSNKLKRRLIVDALFRIGQENLQVSVSELAPLLIDKDEEISKMPVTLFEKWMPDSYLSLSDLLSREDMDEDLKKTIKKILKQLQK